MAYSIGLGLEPGIGPSIPCQAQLTSTTTQRITATDFGTNLCWLLVARDLRRGAARMRLEIVDARPTPRAKIWP
jgi:hypothetical protein